MRIDKNPQPTQPLIRDHASAASPKSASVDGGLRDRLLTSVAPTSVDSLLQLVGDTSAIRESVVNDIKIKIQSGEFLAQQSAVETASAILDL